MKKWTLPSMLAVHTALPESVEASAEVVGAAVTGAVVACCVVGMSEVLGAYCQSFDP